MMTQLPTNNILNVKFPVRGLSILTGMLRRVISILVLTIGYWYSYK